MPVLNKTPSQRAVLPYRTHGTASKKAGGWNATVLQEPKVPPQAQQAKKPSERHQAVPRGPAAKPPVTTLPEVPQEATNVPQEQLDAVPVLGDGTADSATSSEVDFHDEGRAGRAASGGLDLELTELWKWKKVGTKGIETTAFKEAEALGESNPEEFEKIYCFSKNQDIETATVANRVKYTNVETWADKNLAPEVASLFLNSDERPSKNLLAEVLAVAAALKKLDSRRFSLGI
jgi:hypothetical protein